MRKLLIFSFLLISFSAFSQTTNERFEEIEDALRMQRMRNESNSLDNQANELRRLREKNKNSPYVILSDGTVINIDEEVARHKYCKFTWTGNQFVEGYPSFSEYTRVLIKPIPIIIYFELGTKSQDEMTKTIRNNVNQMIKICPMLKNYPNLLNY